jgi:hypothetical protein
MTFSLNCKENALQDDAVVQKNEKLYFTAEYTVSQHVLLEFCFQIANIVLNKYTKCL